MLTSSFTPETHKNIVTTLRWSSSDWENTNSLLKLRNAAFYQTSISFLGSNISQEGDGRGKGGCCADLADSKEHQGTPMLSGLCILLPPLKRSLVPQSPLSPTCWKASPVPLGHRCVQPAQEEDFLSTTPASSRSLSSLRHRRRCLLYQSRSGVVTAAGKPPTLHPFAFYSHKLNPTEKNYDIGDREFLSNSLWKSGDTG